MKPRPDITGLIQRFEEARESLVIQGKIYDDTQAIELTADELRLVAKAMRYWAYWHELPKDPNYES